MSFKKIPLSGQVDYEPEEAKKKILYAYKLAGCSLKATAKVLKVAERTLHRWVVRLQLRNELEVLHDSR